MYLEIPKSDVEGLVESYLDTSISFKEYTYVKNTRSGKTTIFQAPVSLFEFANQFKSVGSIGSPIIEIIKNRLTFLPPIIECISSEYPVFELGITQLITVSYGESISINESDGFCFIVNSFGQKISFGRIIKGLYKPLIDLGWYLRSGQ